MRNTTPRGRPSAEIWSSLAAAAPALVGSGPGQTPPQEADRRLELGQWAADLDPHVVGGPRRRRARALRTRRQRFTRTLAKSDIWQIWYTPARKTPYDKLGNRNGY